MVKKMTIHEYRNLVVEQLPELRLDKRREYINPPMLLKMVAIELFMKKDNESHLSVVTREHLKNLFEDGIHKFNSENF